MTYSQTFIDKHRDLNIDGCDWASWVKEDFTTRMREQGLEVTRIYWSGFCSQGDGACFEGYLADVQAFLRANNLSEQFPMLTESQLQTFAVVSWKHRGHYYHEYCLEFDTAYYNDFADAMSHVYNVQDLNDCGVTIFEEQYDAELAKLFDIVTEAVRDRCRDLYKCLGEEYDYLTSDEAIVETLEANDIIEEDE